MKSKWHLPLVIGLALLLASSFIGCGQSQSEDYQEGYKAGFTEGFNAGLTQSGAEAFPAPSTAPQPKTQPSPTPAGAISWDKAKDQIGDRTTVCGPVAGTRYGATSRGKPTWLNIGKDYPSERFVVIIWGENRGNFPQPPDSYYARKTICVTGLIQEYQGIPQIEVKTPDNIQEQ